MLGTLGAHSPPAGRAETPALYMASGQSGRQPDVAMDMFERGMKTPPEYRVSDLPDMDSNTGASARSPSPWAFRVSTMALNRAHNNDGSGVSTPISGYGRVLSAERAVASRQVAQRASHESALLAAVRKQMDALEEKLVSQISRIQSQNDRLREAAFSRLEEKMAIAEGQQPKLDRRLAELSGHFKGLSEEMQSQIRRVDMMDERLWEWRHQMEEEFQRKYVEFDNHVQKVSSSSRMLHSSLEDAHKKHVKHLHRLESEFNDRIGVHEDTREGLYHLHSRLEAVEQRRDLSEDFAQRDLLPGRPEYLNLGQEVEHHAGILAMLENHVSDMSDKLEQLCQDSIDLHTTSNAQQVELKTVRTLIDTREEHHRLLSERVERSDWENKFEQVRQTLQDDQRRKVETFEKMDVLTHRLEMQEQAYEELRSRHDLLLRRQREFGAVQVDMPIRDLGLDAFAADGLTPRGAVDGMASYPMEDCMARLDVVEHRMASIDPDVNLWPQVGVLVSQLKELGPKVIEHEQRLAKLDAMRHNSTKEHHVPKLDLASSMQPVKSSLQADHDNSKEPEARPFSPRWWKEMCRDSDQKLPRERLGNSTPSRQETRQLHGSFEARIDALTAENDALRTELLAGTKADQQALKKELEEAFAGANEVHEARHRREFEEMRGQIAVLQEGAGNLRAAFNEIITSEDSGESPLDDLLHAVQQDEQLEQEKQRRLLERIDEVCEHLAEVTRERCHEQGYNSLH